MPPTGDSFITLNLPPSFTLPDCMEYFSLTAGPNTSLWRKPPTGDIATAPIIFTSLRGPFTLAEVTVSADWEMEWDQGGLVIFTGPTPEALPLSSSSPSSNRQRTPHMRILSRLQQQNPRACKWVKAGMEFSSGAVQASSVSATADGADWCLSPLNLGQQPADQANSSSTTPASTSTSTSTTAHSLRIKLERIGYSLWVWYQVPSVSPHALTPGEVMRSWKKLREVTWFFYGVENKFVHVGVYASRPNRATTTWFGAAGDDGLEVEFEDLEIF